jgi:hypothetical protein
MSNPKPISRESISSSPPEALHLRAMDNLLFIRQTMESAAAFTAVSGWGQAGVGLLALVAALVAHRQPTVEKWLLTWIITAALALAVLFYAMNRKARALNTPLFSTPGRKFAVSCSPPMLVGAILTLVFYRHQLLQPIPGIWLLLYGTGVVTGGAFSVRVVPIMGVAFMLLGTLALCFSFVWADTFMALGFGLLHIIFGAIIAKQYGG